MTLHSEQTPVGADNSVFRRGLILGLTLAEISLLLVFVLLLVFGGMLKHVSEEATRSQALAREAAAARAQLRKVLSDYAPAASSQQIDAWVKELIAASVSAQENRDLKQQVRDAEAALERVEAAAVKSGVATKPSSVGAERWEAVARDMETAAERIQAGQAAAQAMAAGRDVAARQTFEAKLENEQLRGAVANAQRKLEASGKGTEKPACWARADGRPEYIFDITLSGGGMRIHDRALPHRRAQQAILPTRSIRFDQVLSPQAFRDQTRPLFDWGETRGCRFFVVAIDGTGASEKQIFKQRLRAMEEHFYKFLSN